MFISYYKIIDILSVYCVRIDLFTLMENDTDVHNFNVVYFLSAIFMVADLCHLVFSCLPPERRKHETRLLVIISTFAFRGEDTRTRQTKGDETKYFYPPTREK